MQTTCRRHQGETPDTLNELRFDVRASARPVAIGFVVVGFGLLVAASATLEIDFRARAALVAALMALHGVAIWRLEQRVPDAGRWLAVIGAAALVYLSTAWLGIAAGIVLIVLPPSLAAILLGPKHAIGTAFAETAWLAMMPPATSYDEAATLRLMTLCALWGVTVIVAGASLPVVHLRDWTWDNYLRTSEMLREAQERRVEFAQVVEDLAKANVQLSRQNALAYGLRRAAEDAKVAKEQFVANVSHELRTPLNMITGFSEMILQSPQYYGQLPASLLADLTVIHRNAEQLSHLIDDVLDLSQIEAQQMAIAKEEVDFAEIVNGATTAVRPLYESKGLALVTDMPNDLPRISCDPVRIREVLLNLLSNAGRFTEQGGVQLRVWTTERDLSVSVSDTGPGISASHISKLFQPFHQVDGSVHRRHGGTGLGLAISRRFVELHDGEIWVESTEGVGTTFTFRLPIAPIVPSATSDSHMRGLLPGWEFLQRTHDSVAPRVVVRPRLIVLDQGSFLQNVLSRYLTGSDVIAVGNLEAAASEFNAEPADALIVNETSLPAPFAELREGLPLPERLPVICCSIPGSVAGSSGAGQTDRLIKPIGQAALLERLDQMGIQSGTILVVDDEPDVRQLLGRMLRASGRGYRVLFAQDGQEALQVLAESRPNVILIDLVMPNMDGFQFLERRTRDEELREIPVIIISARDPTGQPIICSSVAVTQGDGLSTHQLLRCIDALISILSVRSLSVGQEAPTDPLGEPASG